MDAEAAAALGDADQRVQEGRLLGDERRETYSPFLPISPTTGRVLYVPMKAVDAKAGTVTFVDENGQDTTLPVTGGNVKLQWKPDFGMRWAALGVDFEMFGKDHQANAPIYSKICRILGAEAPQQFVYELFLDDKGEKISKTKGNGISVEQWLAYAPAESLSLYQWQKPKTAKKLYFDVIPKAVDEYLQFLDAYAKQTPEQQLENPAWHIHGGAPPAKSSPVSSSAPSSAMSPPAPLPPPASDPAPTEAPHEQPGPAVSRRAPRAPRRLPSRRRLRRVVARLGRKLDAQAVRLQLRLARPAHHPVLCLPDRAYGQRAFHHRQPSRLRERAHCRRRVGSRGRSIPPPAPGILCELCRE